MANLSPQSFSMKNDASFIAPLEASAQSSTTFNRMAYMKRLVFELSNPNLRENALRVLSKKTEFFQELAPLLWNSFGIIGMLLKEEITSIYRTIESMNLTLAESTRVCHVLALFQCVAYHPDTKIAFLNAKIHLYLYPFLQTTSKLEPFEYLRTASLGVIGALVKINTQEITSLLPPREIIPLCLHNMEIGTGLSKAVATFIIHKILAVNDGLAYICATPERYFAVGRVLNIVLESMVKKHSTSLLRNIIPCYAYLSDNNRAGNALRSSLPDIFRDPNFVNRLREDPTTWKYAQHLYNNVTRNDQQFPHIKLEEE